MKGNKIEVSRTDDGKILVNKGTWTDVFPEDQREPWAQWYEQMHTHYAYEGYADMAKALRALR